MAAQKAEATGMIRTRATRSASAAMGTAPSTTITPAKPSTPIRTVSLIPRVAWMSGASTRMARGISSITLSTNSTATMAAPPARSPSRKVMGASPTPGSRSSGRTASASRACWSARRRASSASTALVSSATSARRFTPPMFSRVAGLGWC